LKTESVSRSGSASYDPVEIKERKD